MKSYRLNEFAAVNLSDLEDLILYETFKNFSLSMLGIFIPILIYESSGSLILPGIFLFIKALTGVLAGFPVMKSIDRFGFNSGLLSSYIFLLPSIWIIYSFESSLEVITLVAISYSIGSTFHRESMNLEFEESSSSEERNKDAARLFSLPNVGRLLGPLVGGLVSAAFNFQAMLFTALLAILISIIPARSMELKSKTKDFYFKDVFEMEYLEYIPIFISRGVQAIASVAIFSLFTYIFIAGSTSSGFVRSMDTVGFMLVAYLSGEISSRYGRNMIIVTGLIMAGVTYLARIFVQTPVEAFIASLIGGIAFKLYHIPLFSEFADEAEKRDERSFYAAKKLFNSLGKVITMILFVSTTIMFTNRKAFVLVFSIAALSTLTLIAGQNRLKRTL